MVLEFHKNFFGNFEGNFFKELEFMELELHDKHEIYKLEIQKEGRFLHISKTVVN